MNLIYLSQEAIDDIKMNFNRYKKHFMDDTNEWFMELFRKNNWYHESKIQMPEISLNQNSDFNISDRINIELLFDALKDLSPSLASDERLWAGMLFCQFWGFVKYRRADELKSDNVRDVLNSFFFMRGIKRSCFMNCLSRLWWTGYLLFDSKNPNHYHAADIICENAYSSNIVLFSSNNFVSNKNLSLGVIDCISIRKSKGEKIGRYHFVEANKYLNCLGGATLLDQMSRTEVKDLVNKRLNKLYGKIVI